MWRIARAVMRDNRISLETEQVRNMGDQAAIGWSLEERFFDVGVVSSTSGVARNWEKNGGRVLARSRRCLTHRSLLHQRFRRPRFKGFVPR